MVVVCWSLALVFPKRSLMGGTMQPATLLWQPALVGSLFLAGQLLTFLAVARGDVPIARQPSSDWERFNRWPSAHCS
jgi:hypothetical protein